MFPQQNDHVQEIDQTHGDADNVAYEKVVVRIGRCQLTFTISWCACEYVIHPDGYLHDMIYTYHIDHVRHKLGDFLLFTIEVFFVDVEEICMHRALKLDHVSDQMPLKQLIKAGSDEHLCLGRHEAVPDHFIVVLASFLPIEFD